MTVTTLAGPTQWVTVSQLADLPVGLGRAFHLAGHTIAVFRTRTGRVFAVENRCPHRGGPLADGMLAGEQIVCPMHSFRFEPETGECDQANVCAVPTYAVEVIDDVVRVAVPVPAGR